MKTYIILFCIGLTFMSPIFPIRSDLKKAEWLIGTWENKTPRGTVYESWVKINEQEFQAKSYAIVEKDTVVFETITLIQEPEGLFYIPTVKDQNDGLPVRFALKSITDETMVFENPEHNFPQVISYSKNAPDSLIAQISGIRNGQERKISFPMRRIGN